MKLSLASLWDIRVLLELRLNGIDIIRGVRDKANLPLPASMRRHLRRVLEAVNDEIKIAEPERDELLKKWKVCGENKDKLPTKDDECWAEYEQEYNALFMPLDFVIPFSPFKVELLDNLNEVVPDDIELFMYDMNRIFSEQQKEVAAEEITEAGENIAPESAKPDAK